MASIVRVGIAKIGYNNLTRQLCKVSVNSVLTDLISVLHRNMETMLYHHPRVNYQYKQYSCMYNI